MQVLVDGLLTAYETSGKGKAVLLLHGWSDQASGLKGLQTELAKQFAVIAPDLPGFGGTQAPAAAWGLDEYAEFIKHFLGKINVKNLYAIVGHSNGGAIALRALDRETLTAEKLVLLASAGIRNVGGSRRGVLKAVTKAGKMLTMPLSESVKTRLRRTLYSTVGSDMLVAEHMQGTFKRIVSDDVQVNAMRLTVPTLLLYGENDTDTPVWFGEKFHELIQVSTLEVLPTAGHFVHLDCPKEVARAILEFLG